MKKILRVAICDDDMLFTTELERLLEEIFNFLQVSFEISVFFHGEKLLDYLSLESVFDILFLDIQMEPTCGIDVAKAIYADYDNQVQEIIYISTTDDYLREIISLRKAYDFLDKPIDNKKALITIEGCIKNIERNKGIFTYTFKNDRGFVRKKDIIYFVNRNKHIEVITRGVSHKFRGTFPELMEGFVMDDFAQSSRQHFVNLHAVLKITPTMLLMVNNDEIPLTRKFSESLTCKLSQLYG